MSVQISDLAPDFEAKANARSEPGSASYSARPQFEHPLGGDISMRSRGLRYNLAFTAFLFIALVVSGFVVLPQLTGNAQTLNGAFLGAAIPTLTLILISGLERLWPAAGPRKPLDRWLLHVQIRFASALLGGVIGALTLMGINALADRYGFTLGLIDLNFGADGILILLATAWTVLVCRDFFFYWLHRLQHEIPFLWQHHKLHHIDRELEMVTTTRTNWVESVMSAITITLPFTFLFKTAPLNPWELGIFSGLIVSTFNVSLVASHANLRMNWHWMNLVWCTPQVHRVHHSCLPEHHDKNYCMTLPLWDILFGTYYYPKPGEFPPTGVEGEKEIETFWESQIYTLREWAKYFRQRRAEKMAAKIAKSGSAG